MHHKLLSSSDSQNFLFVWSITNTGVLKREPRLIVSQSIGFLLALYYLARYVPHSPPRSTTMPGTIAQHLQGCAAVVGLTLAAASSLPLGDSTRWIGLGGVLFNIILFASPLAALKTVLETRSASSIPLPFTIATALSCALWTVYGALAMKDPAIYFPTIVGLMLGLAQLGLKLWFGSGSTQKAPKSLLNMNGGAVAANKRRASDSDENVEMQNLHQHPN